MATRVRCLAWHRRPPVAPIRSTWSYILLVALWALTRAASPGIISAGWAQRLSGSSIAASPSSCASPPGCRQRPARLSAHNAKQAHQARGLISTEFELKLAAPAAKLEELKRVLLTMPTVKSEVRSKLVSTYYDKPTLALHRERLSLRVRKQGSEFVQTVKAENPTQADILERKEWEDQIPSKRPVLDAPKTGKRLPDTVRGEELRPVFTTTVTRTVIEISPGPSARIEAAIDEGEIRTSKGDAVEPISEIELELKNGDPRVIFDAALQLLEAAPIRIETRSKAGRGYRLLGTDGLMPQAVRVGPVALDPAMSVEAALERIGRRCLPHLLIKEQHTLAGEPEGIHQMRVAIRRFRSALLALKRALPIKHYR